SFGILKRRFTLLDAAPEYNITMQAKLVPALCALHNFLRIHDPSEDPVSNFAQEPNTTIQTGDAAPVTEIETQAEGEETDEYRRASNRRDKIAQAMWAAYQEELERRDMVTGQLE
ncbi:hypothetical protein BDN72DRAFT_780076, partial [Pluteus cervinus]